MTLHVSLVWLVRNRVRLGNPHPVWENVSKSINQAATRYHNAGARRLAERKKQKIQNSWCPPMLGELSFTTDAAFSNAHAVSGIVQRDHTGQVQRAWTNHFRSPNAFCAELATIIHALMIAADMKVVKAKFESDSMRVVFALNGLEEFEEWQATDLLAKGKRILAKNPLWNCVHLSRDCNRSAHRLAQWAKTTNFIGDVNLDSLPRSILSERDDDDVTLFDEDNDMNA